MANSFTPHTNETFTTASGKIVRFEDIFVGIDNELRRYEWHGGKEMLPEDLENLRQDAFVKAIVASKGSYDPEKCRCPQAYGAAIARMCERDAFCKSVKRSQHFTAFEYGNEDKWESIPYKFSGYRGDEFEADRELKTKEAMSFIWDKMAKLGESYRKVLKLSLAGYTSKEISNLLGCSVSAVHSRLFKARKAFAAALGPEFLAQYGIKHRA